MNVLAKLSNMSNEDKAGGDLSTMETKHASRLVHLPAVLHEHICKLTEVYIYLYIIIIIYLFLHVQVNFVRGDSLLNYTGLWAFKFSFLTLMCRMRQKQHCRREEVVQKSTDE